MVIVAAAEVLLWFRLPNTLPGLQGQWRYRSPFLIALLAVLPFVMIPPLRAVVAGQLERLHRAPGVARAVVAAALGLLAIAFAWWRITSALQPLFPMLHDEHSYLLQAQHIARFRLWMPAHPMADFFDSFHILVEPVYASIYWPGTGLFGAVGVWLNLPHFAIPLVLYGAVVALTCYVASEATDTLSGILAGLIIAAQPYLAAFSTQMMSQMPAAVLGAALFWGFLRWRAAPSDRRLAWVAVLGGLAGWMAVTRPVDAISFAAPIGLTVLIASIKAAREKGTGTGRRVGAVLAIAAAAALPFLALQLALNYGTTGRVLHPPYVEYLNQYQPGTEYGAPEGDAAPRQVSDLVQKQELYERFVVAELTRRREQGAARLFVQERLPMTLQATLPSIWLIPLPLAGALMAVGAWRRRWMGEEAVDLTVPRLAAATIGLFVVLYAANPFYLAHYALPLAVPMTVLAASGLNGIARATRRGPRRFVLTLLAGWLTVGLVLSVMHYRIKRPFQWQTAQRDLKFKYRDLPERLTGRTLVLVGYSGSPQGGAYHWEPVYNSDVAWPDDADIVWAHDLEGRREQILEYYAQRQPDRVVVIWKRYEDAVFDLGPVNRALLDQRAGVIDRTIEQALSSEEGEAEP